MAQNLNDAFAWIRDLYTEVARLKSGAFLENSSVSQGRMRFIGGLLLIDSGGTLQVIGHFNGEGDFEWSGPWKFDSGDGEIAGNVKLTGDFDLIGRLINGDVRIEGNRIHIGGMLLDPSAHGGAVVFPNGAQVFTDVDTVQLFKGNSVVQVSDDYARLQYGGNVLEIREEGVRVSLAALGTYSAAEMSVPVGTLRLTSAGALERAI